ncbi:unnamed protein product [Vitrella brassicaformis CCMP3155]|uniref:Uncharacterized protein n=2 Tax=Vitrella brassicaformis TaxID=1169539 RepID=A0A0G4ECF8_VITBC|nr:unnamed protein product [Vitrella brassicaformis CCMP3155]|eukprot:CEL93404.1 unnamed protein product [Vitrella brassicaformis CCMP3155]
MIRKLGDARGSLDGEAARSNPCLSGAMAAASSSSSSAASPPQAEAMASCSSAGRHREGTRVLLTSGTRRDANESYVWLKADVYRIEEISKGTLLFMREVGGREEFKQVVPHRTSAPMNTNPQPPVVWDVSRKAPDGFGDGPDGSLATLFSFMTPCELSALFPDRPVEPLTNQQADPTIHDAAVHQQTHITVDCSTRAECHFWESMTPEAAFQLGKCLINVTALTVLQPHDRPSWCLFTMIGIVEGHAAGRRKAYEAKDRQQHMPEGSLESIQFVASPISHADRLGRQHCPTRKNRNSSNNRGIYIKARRGGERTKRKRPPIPPPIRAPPTLPALRTVTGAVPEHAVVSSSRWVMPALEHIDQQGWTADQLGLFISTSLSLQHVGGRVRGAEWAAVFRYVLVARDGQPGRLRRLRSIGLIHYWTPEEVDELQEVLTSRGCRKSLKSVSVRILPIVDHHTLPALVAVDSLIDKCCVPHDVDITVLPETNRTTRYFQLSVLYADDLPRSLSPFVRKALQEAARVAYELRYTISQHDITHSVDDPSQTAIEIAESLSFDNVRLVNAMSAYGFAPPPGTPSPAPAIIDHLQPFPAAKELQICSGLGGPVGSLLAQKMPMEVETVIMPSAVRSEDKTRVLEALGEEREVDTIYVGAAGNALSALDGWRAESFPVTHQMSVQFGDDRYRCIHFRVALTSPGVRSSLKSLSVRVPASIDHNTFPALLAADSLINKCRVSDDGDITVLRQSETTRRSDRPPSYFQLSVLYADDLPRSLSPFVRKALQEAARVAYELRYTISQHDITHSVDDPSQTAIEIAESLSFDNVRYVTVSNADGFVPPPGAPAPTPTIINHLQPFPGADKLRVFSGLGGPVGSLLAQKMPMEVERVIMPSAVSAADQSGVMEALGEGRKVDTVWVGVAVGGALSPLNGWKPESFPAINKMFIDSAVPGHVRAVVAARRISDGLSSVVRSMRGLERVIVSVNRRSVRSAIRRLLPDSASSTFTIYLFVDT